MPWRASVTVALAGVALLIAGVGMSPAEETSAVWVDSGTTLLSVTADTDPPPLTPPITSEDANTVVSENPEDWEWTAQDNPRPTPNQFCVQYQITSPSATPVAWRVTLHLGLPPFNWTAPFTTSMISNIFFPSGYFATLTAAPDFATSGLVYVTPDPFNSDQLVSSSRPVEAKFCANVPDPPWQPAGPTTYEVTSVTLDTPPASNPCVTVVVTGYLPYFVGFTANFDYQAVLNQALTNSVIDQATYDRWLPLVTWSGTSAQGATGADYLVTLTGYSAATRNVDQWAPVTLQSCAY